MLNFLHAGTLARNVSVLEDEVEKKGQEFDGFRKKTSGAPDQYSGTQRPNEDIGAAFSESPAAQTGTEQFEVVRNIRAAYEQAEASHLEQQVVDFHSPDPTPRHPVSPDSSPAPSPLGNTIRLYSPTQGKADFHGAWNTLKSILSSQKTHDTFVFDCSRLENLEDGEISYLERFVQVARQSRNRSTIVGCTPKLSQVLKNRPTLTQLVEP